MPRPAFKFSRSDCAGHILARLARIGYAVHMAPGKFSEAIQSMDEQTLAVLSMFADSGTDEAFLERLKGAGLDANQL